MLGKVLCYLGFHDWYRSVKLQYINGIGCCVPVMKCDRCQKRGIMAAPSYDDILRVINTQDIAFLERKELVLAARNLQERISGATFKEVLVTLIGFVKEVKPVVPLRG